jgi:1,4-dihydroxy-2-naphthoyl-CoA synthase
VSHLLCERVGRVLVLTLNRPERHNAITPELAEDLVIEVERAGDDVRAAVIRGAGRSFCAGYDLSGGRREPGGRGVTAEARGLRHLSRCWDRLLHAPLPVIAQIHGHCLAGGTDLAGHCDLVITAEDASIGFPADRQQVRHQPGIGADGPHRPAGGGGRPGRDGAPDRACPGVRRAGPDRGVAGGGGPSRRPFRAGPRP